MYKLRLERIHCFALQKNYIFVVMFNKSVLTLILLNLLLVAYFYLRPYSFYKAIAIRSIDNFQELIISDTINQDIFTINTISNLSQRRGTVYTHNRAKRVKLFKEGFGNCSNQAVGMGTILSDYKKRFQVVHLMPIFQFLEGGGHTVLQTTYNDTLMIFDLLGRSILRKNNHLINYLDLDSLANKKSNSPIAFDILNPNRASVESYYNPDINKNIIIGIVPDDEYRKFYSFTKYLYTPEKESRITQAFFYSITTLVNKLPHIYVLEKDYEKLNQNKKFKFDRFLSFTLVINTWIIFTLLLLFFLNKLYIRIKG
jgi:hypothetical protein